MLKRLSNRLLRTVNRSFVQKKEMTPEIWSKLLEKEDELKRSLDNEVQLVSMYDYFKANMHSKASLSRLIAEKEEEIRQEEEEMKEYERKNDDKQNGRIKRYLYFNLALLGFYALYKLSGIEINIVVEDMSENTDDDLKNKQKRDTFKHIYKRYKETTKIDAPTFKNIKGLDEILPEFEELTRYMKTPEKFEKMGAKIPKGILLTGPPGVGKTLIAKALANECKWNFKYASGSEFSTKYVGEGARMIKELFTDAKTNKPTIIFIDELDSIAGKRERRSGLSNQTINQLLTEIDGFSSDEQVLFIGATNLYDSIDKAVLRPGRIDKVIDIPLPNLKGRKEILQHYINRIKHTKKIDIDGFARRTTGMTPADLRNLVNTAAIRAIKLDKKVTGNSELDYAYDRILMGIKSSNTGFGFTKDDIRSVAIHEIGHTLAAVLSNTAMDIHKVTVLSVGGSLGSTSLKPKIEPEAFTQRDVIGQLDIALGGRVAEEIYLGKDQITIGCSDDIDKATKTAMEYYANYGLSSVEDEGSGLAAYQDIKKLSDDRKYLIEQKVNKLLLDRYSVVKGWFKENKETFNRLVDELTIKETLSKDEIMKIINN